MQHHHPAEAANVSAASNALPSLTAALTHGSAPEQHQAWNPPPPPPPPQEASSSPSYTSSSVSAPYLQPPPGHAYHQGQGVAQQSSQQTQHSQAGLPPLHRHIQHEALPSMEWRGPAPQGSQEHHQVLHPQHHHAHLSDLSGATPYHHVGHLSSHEAATTPVLNDPTSHSAQIHDQSHGHGGSHGGHDHGHHAQTGTPSLVPHSTQLISQHTTAEPLTTSPTNPRGHNPADGSNYLYDPYSSQAGLHHANNPGQSQSPTPDPSLIAQPLSNSPDPLSESGRVVEGGGPPVGSRLRLRPHSTPATLCWLEKNYELAEGVCIPRNVVYFNYVDFCSKNHMQPVNAASFGKIIRQMFTNLTTRRLGTRGQSRYHYYGLAVKPDSIYYSPNYSSRKADQQVEQKFYPKVHLARVASQLTSSSEGTLVSPAYGSIGSASSIPGASSGFASVQHLPEFPSFHEFDQASTIPRDKLQTLLTMYRVHCQRIMDSVNKFSFSEIPHLFTHFWQEIPPHIADLLGQNIVVTLIGVCDAILYRTILKAILPTAIQMFPENVLKIIRKFADDVVGSLQYSLKQVPENLIYVKMKLVRQMSKMLKRRTSVNHLYQTACLVITPSNHSIYDTMVRDWSRIDIKKIIEECASKACSVDEIKAISDTFQRMLDQRSTTAQFCLWMNGVVDAYTKMDPEACHLISKIRRFLVIWTSMSNKLLKQLRQAKDATSMSAFQLLQLLLNECILHEVERLVCEDSMRELMVNMVNAQATELSDSSFVDSLGLDFLSGPNVFQQHTSLNVVNLDSEMAQNYTAKGTHATQATSSATLTTSTAITSAKRIKLEKIGGESMAN